MTRTTRLLARNRWIAIFVAVLIGGSMGALSVFYGPAIYTAKATMYVTPPTSSTPTDAVMGDQYALNRTQLYLQLLASNELAQQVAAALKSSEPPGVLSSRIEATSLHQTPLLIIQARGSTPDEARSLAQAYADALPDFARSVERSSGLREDPPVAPVALPIEVESDKDGLKPWLRLALWSLAFGLPVAICAMWAGYRHPVVRKVNALRGKIAAAFIETMDDAAQCLRVQALIFATPNATRHVIFTTARSDDARANLLGGVLDSLGDNEIQYDQVNVDALADFQVSRRSRGLLIVDAPALLDASHEAAALTGRFDTAVIFTRRGKTFVEDVISLGKLLEMNGIDVRGVVIVRPTRAGAGRRPVGGTASKSLEASDRPWPTIDVLEEEMSGRSNGRTVP